MRIAVYLLALIVLLPYLALSAGFLVLGRAIAGGTLAAFFETLLAVAVWLVPWGFVACALALAVLLAAAASERWRWIGATCLCALATASIAVIVAVPSGPLDGGQWLFLLPAALACVGTGWIAASERRQRRSRNAAATLAPSP